MQLQYFVANFSYAFIDIDSPSLESILRAATMAKFDAPKEEKKEWLNSQQQAELARAHENQNSYSKHYCPYIKKLDGTIKTT